MAGGAGPIRTVATGNATSTAIVVTMGANTMACCAGLIGTVAAATATGSGYAAKQIWLMAHHQTLVTA